MKINQILNKPFENYFGSLEIKPNIKPGHGSCCTCQTCGYNYDDCNCTIREVLKDLDIAKQQIIAILELMKKVDNGYNQAIDDVISKIKE